MNKTQYIVLAKKTIRSEWQIIFAIDKMEENAWDEVCNVLEKFCGYKCIVLESKFGSYVTEKEIIR